LFITNRLLTRDSFKGSSDMTINEEATNEIDAEFESAASQTSRYVHKKSSMQHMKPPRLSHHHDSLPPMAFEEGFAQQVEEGEGEGEGMGSLTPQASFVEEEESSEELRCVICVIR
jgi:hypothetical protein